MNNPEFFSALPRPIHNNRKHYIKERSNLLGQQRKKNFRMNKKTKEKKQDGSLTTASNRGPIVKAKLDRTKLAPIDLSKISATTLVKEKTPGKEKQFEAQSPMMSPIFCTQKIVLPPITKKINFNHTIGSEFIIRSNSLFRPNSENSKVRKNNKTSSKFKFGQTGFAMEERPRLVSCGRVRIASYSEKKYRKRKRRKSAAPISKNILFKEKRCDRKTSELISQIESLDFNLDFGQPKIQKLNRIGTRGSIGFSEHSESSKVSESRSRASSKCIWAFEDFFKLKTQNKQDQNNFEQKFKNLLKGKLIGEGAYGKVFTGLNTETGKILAIKEALIDNSGRSTGLSLGKYFIYFLENEILLLSQLDHPNILNYHGFRRKNDHLQIITDFLTGGSLKDLIKEIGIFPKRVIKLYAKQILKGLVHIHSKGKKKIIFIGIVHRDLKCANILLDSSGKVKLADFGASLKNAGLELNAESQSMVQILESPKGYFFFSKN